MPLEISEIGIQMRVGSGTAQRSAASATGSGPDLASGGDAQGGMGEDAQAAIVEACVRQVLATLKAREAR